MSSRPVRRVMGRGTVYRRSNGSWAGEITLGGVRRTVYAGSQAACLAKLQVAQSQLAGGLPPVDQRTTLGQYLTGWLQAVAPRLRPATFDRYKGIVTVQLIPELGGVKLAKLSPADVDLMLARLLGSGLSPRTVAHVRAVLRTALTDAEKRGQVARNVATLSDAPKVPYQPPRILSPEAAAGVLAAIEDPQLRRMATLAVHTGLRQGELLGLRWQDVAWQTGELHVTQALQRIDGESRLVEVKSRTSRRALPLTPIALAALTEERECQSEARAAAGKRWREQIVGMIFTSDLGRPRNGTTVTHTFADALAGAGLAPMHWHHLRHAFAGLMLASGVDLGTVSALLGHSSVSLTLSTYAGVAPSLKRQAAERLGLLLAQSATSRAPTIPEPASKGSTLTRAV